MSRIEVYRNLKDQVVAYAGALTPGVLGSRCSACPAWTLQDVMAHHIHAQRSWLEGDFPLAALAAITTGDEHERADAQLIRDAWAEQGVAHRRGRSLSELSDEWDDLIGQLDETMPLTLDLTVHFDDIRETVEGEVPRNDVDTVPSLRRFHRLQVMRFEGRGLDPISLSSTDDNQTLSSSEEATTVSGPSYELLRCLASRRSRAAADRVLDWGGLGPERREAFPVYGWPI